MRTGLTYFDGRGQLVAEVERDLGRVVQTVHSYR